MAEAPDDTPISFSGSDNKQTQVFGLAGGTYRVAVSLSPTYDGGCRLHAYLVAEGAQYGGDLAVVDTQTRRAYSETGYVQSVKPGRYWVKVIAMCPWQATLSR